MAIAMSYKQKTFPLGTLRIPHVDLTTGSYIEGAISSNSSVRGFINLTMHINYLRSCALPRAIKESPCDFVLSLAVTALKLALFIEAFLLANIYAFILAFLVSAGSYYMAVKEFAQPEFKYSSVPWYISKPSTRIGQIFYYSLIWPAFFGLIASPVEAYTRPQRIEQSLSQRIKQFEKRLPAVCKFYREHALEIVEALKKSVKVEWEQYHPMNVPSRAEVLEEVQDTFKNWIQFLRKFDPRIRLLGT